MSALPGCRDSNPMHSFWIPSYLYFLKHLTPLVTALETCFPVTSCAHFTSSAIYKDFSKLSPSPHLLSSSCSLKYTHLLMIPKWTDFSPASQNHTFNSLLDICTYMSTRIFKTVWLHTYYDDYLQDKQKIWSVGKDAENQCPCVLPVGI
jgi:hypothetical protein